MPDERSLPDFINGYLDYTNAWNEAPETFRTWAAISTIAAALQRRVRLPWGQYLYPNMYVLLVAPAGKARKGTGMNPALALLREVGVELAANTTTRAALIRKLKQINYPDQALGPVYTHSSLTVFSKEFTVFMGYNNLQLMADLCDLYDCDDNWEYDTKTQGKDTISNVWLNIIGATTPQTLQAAMPMDLATGGLLSRIVTVYESQKGKPIVFPRITDYEREVHKKLKQDLESIKLLRGEFTMEKGAEHIYEDFYNTNHETPPFEGTVLDTYPTRRPTHLLKMCMVVSASSRDNMIITEEDMNRSVSILTRTEKRMLEAYRGIGQADYSDVMNRVMQLVALRKRVYKRDLMKAFYADADPDLMDKIIRAMEQMGFAKVMMTSGGTPMEVVMYTEEQENTQP